VNGATDELFGYGDPRGVRELRVALASYLGRSRAVRAHPDQIVIFSGFAEALSILAETLRELGRTTIAVEDPALPFHPVFCIRAGLAVERVPVDDDGLQVERLRAGVADAVGHPAHQYPLEFLMAPASGRPRQGRGQEDGSSRTPREFRFDRQPVGALQGLDPSRVIYGGTASKSLDAGLHLAWLVLPPSLVEPVTETIRWRVGVSSIEQAALADFITRGQLDRHLRQMRLIYRRRRDSVLSALFRHAPWMTMTGASAGLHGTILLREPLSGRIQILRLPSEHRGCTR
jgi:GntR family transcriptional regulator/MocR family aminotransferase